MSIIRYCLPLYGNIRLTESDPIHSNQYKLQVIQNDMLRTIYSLKIRDKVNMKILRQHHNIHSINQMTCQAIASEMRKAIHHDTMPRTADFLELTRKPAINTRSSETGILRMPKCRLSNTMDSFLIKGLKIWNKLPATLRTTDIEDNKFKSLLSKWIQSHIIN